MIARLAPGLSLARLNEIPDHGALVVDAGYGDAWLSVLLTRAGNRVAAFHNRCPHAGYPLQRADGHVLVQERRYLVCGAHGASYDLETGACAGGPCNGAALTRLAIHVQKGVVISA